jgi:hypothetical protein
MLFKKPKSFSAEQVRIAPKLSELAPYCNHNIGPRFALSFGLDAVKNREAVTQLHREGILVAVSPVKRPEAHS